MPQPVGILFVLNIAVIGAGYVGLVTGVCLSLGGGRNVRCVELDKKRVRQINRGKPPFFEPDLERLLRAGLQKGDFAATTNLQEALADADIIMIAVGTPPLLSGQTDLRALKTASAAIGETLQKRPSGRPPPLVAVRSTVPPGTTNRIVRPLLKQRCGEKGALVAMIPEFLREGSAVADFLSPDRVVIGADDDKAARVAARLATSLKAPIVRVSIAEAELIKYASNALLATLVSFSNDIANLAESTPGADARAVFRALHLDRRLSVPARGKPAFSGICSYLLPGPGYGGSCLPKDLASLRHYGKKRRVPTPMLDAAAKVNDKRAAHTAWRIAEACGGLSGRRIALLGLAFKDATSDTRASPSLALAKVLRQSGAVVSAFDSHLLRDGAAIPGVRIAKTPKLALAGADAAVIMTLSEEWRALPWDVLLRSMRRPVIFDARGALDGIAAPAAAIYQTIGRG